MLLVFFQTGLQSCNGSEVKDALSHCHLNSNSDEQQEVFGGFGDQPQQQYTSSGPASTKSVGVKYFENCALQPNTP